MTFSKRMPPSLAFSGAGFLTSYHLGVADCLRRQGLLDGVTNVKPNDSNNDNKPMILSGCSGGALVITSISLKIRSDDAMAVSMRIAKEARSKGGLLDALHPEVSLVDRVADELQQLTKDLDEEEVLRRVSGGNLRVGLTDSGFFPFFRRQNGDEAYLYANEYDSLDEILAACTLSAYVPGLTGPAPLERSAQSHPAVTHATEIVKEMMKRGAVKDVRGNSKHQLRSKSSEIWDGGLAKLYPTINSKTILVSPFAGTFNNPTISPKKAPEETDGFPLPKLSAAISDFASFDVSTENMRTLRYALFSSTADDLQSWFALGYDSCLGFLSDETMLEKFSVGSSGTQQVLEENLSKSA